MFEYGNSKDCTLGWHRWCMGGNSYICRLHYCNRADLISYSFVNFVTFLVSTKRKFRTFDITVLNKCTLTQSQRISALQKHETYYEMRERDQGLA